MAEDKAIVKTTSTEDSYSNVLEYAKELKCEAIIKPNCKLCNSAHRQEAEELFADGKSAHFVYKWLLNKKEDISSRAVHNHFVQHYQKPIMEQRIKAYAENLEEWSRIKAGEEDRLRLYATLLDQQIHNLGSTISNTNTEEMRKGQETLIKLIGEASKIQEQLRSLRQENEPIKILVERLNMGLTMKYNDAKNLETKQILSEIVDLIVKETEIVSNGNK